MKKKLLMTISLCVSMALSGCMVSPQNSESTGAGMDSSEISTENSIVESTENTTDSIEESSKESFEESSTSEEDSAKSEEDSSVETVVSDELSIHFLQLGNKTSGDCTLIKVGDTEVLIDAGSTDGSAKTIVPYISKYCTDGKLEYVIATHGDADHISAFVGTSSYSGVFEKFECGTIIDFAQTTKKTQVYQNYVRLREAEVAEGAQHYTALQCWNNADGAQRSYTLGEGITLNILYQKYYEQKTSTENNYSVCTLITQGDKNFLFTGDLEESGEKSLVESNDLPQCVLYKAGHHGSNTSSTNALISVIQPEIVVANCCCGDKYDFPHQEFINTIAPYTQRVYIPVMTTSSGYALLNGNIVVSSTDAGVSVNCSNNNTLFKDTDWFKANRTMPNAWK